jgi:hypothetical protein
MRISSGVERDKLESFLSAFPDRELFALTQSDFIAAISSPFVDSEKTESNQLADIVPMIVKTGNGSAIANRIGHWSSLVRWLRMKPEF